MGGQVDDDDAFEEQLEQGSLGSPAARHIRRAGEEAARQRHEAEGGPALTQVIVCRPANPEDYGDERTSEYVRVLLGTLLATQQAMPPAAGTETCHYCNVAVEYGQRHLVEIERFRAQGIKHEFACIICVIAAGLGGPEDKSIHVDLTKDRP